MKWKVFGRMRPWPEVVSESVIGCQTVSGFDKWDKIAKQGKTKAK